MHTARDEPVNQSNVSIEKTIVKMPLRDPVEELHYSLGVVVGFDDLGDLTGTKGGNDAGQIGAIFPAGAGEYAMCFGD